MRFLRACASVATAKERGTQSGGRKNASSEKKVRVRSVNTSPERMSEPGKGQARQTNSLRGQREQSVKIATSPITPTMIRTARDVTRGWRMHEKRDINHIQIKRRTRAQPASPAPGVRPIILHPSYSTRSWAVPTHPNRPYPAPSPAAAATAAISRPVPPTAQPPSAPPGSNGTDGTWPRGRRGGTATCGYGWLASTPAAEALPGRDAGGCTA